MRRGTLLTRAGDGQLGMGLLGPGAILHAGDAVDGRGIGSREEVMGILGVWRLLGVEGLLLVGGGVLGQLVGRVGVALGAAEPIVHDGQARMSICGRHVVIDQKGNRGGNPTPAQTVRLGYKWPRLCGAVRCGAARRRRGAKRAIQVQPSPARVQAESVQSNPVQCDAMQCDPTQPRAVLVDGLDVDGPGGSRSTS